MHLSHDRHALVTCASFSVNALSRARLLADLTQVNPFELLQGQAENSGGYKLILNLQEASSPGARWLSAMLHHEKQEILKLWVATLLAVTMLIVVARNLWKRDKPDRNGELTGEASSIIAGLVIRLAMRLAMRLVRELETPDWRRER